jgi:hypothetical protein
MDGATLSRPARSRGSPIARAFEASRLSNELIASAYDRILAAAVQAATGATRPSARRSPDPSPEPVVPSTGGRNP